MGASTVFGFALLLLGALCGGSFGLPSKFAKKSTPWETLGGGSISACGAFMVKLWRDRTWHTFVAPGGM